jgi:hypothetical protein
VLYARKKVDARRFERKSDSVVTLQILALSKHCLSTQYPHYASYYYLMRISLRLPGLFLEPMAYLVPIYCKFSLKTLL